jgi:glutamate-5-semialdehyde dehydrogenase
MMTTIDILAMAKRARAATRTIATSTTAQRDLALTKIAEYLNDPAEQTAILAANAIDMQNAQAAGLRPS